MNQLSSRATKHEPVFINPFSPASRELGAKQVARRGCSTVDIEDAITSTRRRLWDDEGYSLDAAGNRLCDLHRRDGMQLAGKYGAQAEESAACRIQAAARRAWTLRLVRNLRTEIALLAARRLQAGARCMLMQKRTFRSYTETLWAEVMAEVVEGRAEDQRRRQGQAARSLQYAWRAVSRARRRSTAGWTRPPGVRYTYGTMDGMAAPGPAVAVASCATGGTQQVGIGGGDLSGARDDEEPAWLREAAQLLLLTRPHEGVGVTSVTVLWTGCETRPADTAVGVQTEDLTAFEGNPMLAAGVRSDPCAPTRSGGRQRRRHRLRKQQLVREEEVRTAEVASAAIQESIEAELASHDERMAAVMEDTWLLAEAGEASVDGWGDEEGGGFRPDLRPPVRNQDAARATAGKLFESAGDPTGQRIREAAFEARCQRAGITTDCSPARAAALRQHEDRVAAARGRMIDKFGEDWREIVEANLAGFRASLECC